MDKTFIFGLGIAILSLLFRFVIKAIPQAIAWVGIIFGITLMLISSLYWIYERLHPKPAMPSVKSDMNPEKPNVVLLPTPSQLNLHNNGKQDIYLWGSKFADTPQNIEKVPRIIPVSNFYYFLTDKLESDARRVIGTIGEQLVPFEVYLADLSQHHYIAKFALLIQIKNGVVTIHTQQLGISQEEWG